jgi:hypothetical protein
MILTLAQTSRVPSFTAFSKIKPAWPRPEDSVGTWYRRMGRNECWEANGPARETFDQIAGEIKKYLNRCSDPDPATPPVTWSMYMIGKTKETAAPTIMFCCEQRGPRRKVRKTVLESGILSGYPGIITGDCSTPPEGDRLVQLAGEEKLTLPSWKTSPDSSRKIVYKPSEMGTCSQIFIQSTTEKACTVRKASRGGIVQIGSKHYITTVAHAFIEIPKPPTRDRCGDDFEFDIDGESDIDSDDNEDDSSDFAGRRHISMYHLQSTICHLSDICGRISLTILP